MDGNSACSSSNSGRYSSQTGVLCGLEDRSPCSLAVVGADLYCLNCGNNFGDDNSRLYTANGLSHLSVKRFGLLDPLASALGRSTMRIMREYP